LKLALCFTAGGDGLSSVKNGSRARNWHHPFPQARFKTKLEARVHDAYNQLFHGHRTAWEAEKFLREELAGPDGIISDEALSEEARQTKQYRRWQKKQQKLETSAGREKTGNGKKYRKSPMSFREAFELVFGTERQVERCVAILKQHPWMPPGVTYRWNDDKVVLVFDYLAMKRAQQSRRDVQGLISEFE